MSEKSYFKYFDGKGSILTLLTDNMRFSSPKLFNDPYDFNFLHQPPFSASEMRALMAVSFLKSIREGSIPPLIQKLANETGKKLIHPSELTLSDEELLYLFMGEGTELPELHNNHFLQKTAEINKLLVSLSEDHFVYCLTTTPSSNYMWTKYADYHRGAVLSFNSVAELDNVFLIAKEVNYTDTPPSYGTKEEWNQFIQYGKPLNHEKIYKDRTLTKSPEWKEENEWRIVIPSPERKGRDYEYVAFRPRELTGIYFGHKMPELEKETILAIRRMKFTKTPVYQAILKPNLREVEFVEIT
jgi:hypothetical protein